MLKTTFKICRHCKKQFWRNKQSLKVWDRAIYCSRECNDVFKRKTNKTPTIKPCQHCGKDFEKPYTLSWIKWSGRKFCSRECADIGKIRKAPSTAFKKGQVPHNFMETGYGYGAVHQWLRRHCVKTGTCESCKTTGKKTDWANISGEYKRDRADFYELCKRCHTFMDRLNPHHPTIY